MLVSKRFLLCLASALLLNTAALLAAEQPVEPAFPGKLAAAEFEAGAARPNPTAGGNSLALTAARWQAPLAPKGSRRWRNAWVASALAVAAANAADIVSSRNLAEHNPLLRNSRGGFDARKGALIKTGATGGLLLVQFLLRRSARDGHLDKSFTIINGAAAGVVGATAARNFGIQR